MEYVKSVVGFLVLLSLAIASQAEDTAVKTPTFEPSDYFLYFRTEKSDFEDRDDNLTFVGHVQIEGKLNVPSGFNSNFSVILNAPTKFYGYKSGLQRKKGSGQFEMISRDSKWQNSTIIFNFKQEDLQYDIFKIFITYEAAYENDMTGFYRSSYKTKNGKTRWLLTSHFEPIFARKAFPCFDKPNLKANFEIFIDVPKELPNYHVLSNTPCVKSNANSSTHYLFKCKKTITPMSTYLVAFTISDFTSTDVLEFESDFNAGKGQYPKKRKLQTYGNPDVVNKEADLSQKAGQQALTKLTNYLGIGYAFEKVDQVAIPDFSAGAMENWGLISYREKILFFNNKTGTTPVKQSNVLTVTHELVHQWFGNLVTLESWDYIWLNEAFATYLQYLIGSQLENPNTSTWNYKEQMLVNDIHLRAFETDGYPNAKQLSFIIGDESLAFSFFNDISYSKGSAILRMWDLSMEKGKFRTSLNAYLKERQGKAANPSHLYKAFKENANMNKDFFYLWTEQPGYPVVEVTKKGGSYVLTQSRFLWQKPALPDKTKYMIPISYTTEQKCDWNTKPDIWLHEKEEKINTSSKWIIVNNQQAGYYRVNYDKDNWIALSNILLKNYSMIHELNRAQIVNDVFSLARSYQKIYVDYSIALELSKYLNKENSFVVLKTALSGFDFLRSRLYTASFYKSFLNHVLEIVKPHFKGLKVSGLSHLEQLKTIEISRWACSLNYEPCVKEAKTLFKNSSLYPDTRETILCTVIKTDDKAWEEIFSLYEKETDSAIKVMYLSVLGCTENKNLLKKYLDLTITKNSKIRKQDYIYVMSAVSSNPNNIELAMSFVEANYKAIAIEYGGINPLGRALVGIARKLNHKEDYKRMENLAKKVSLFPEGKPALDSITSALSIIQNNALWTEDRKPQIAKYFGAGSVFSRFRF